MAHLVTPLPAHNDTILIGGVRHKIEETTANSAQASSNTAWPAAETHNHEPL